jgi:hypothetical protein
MKLRTLLSAVLLFALVAVYAYAADITGKWTAEYQGRNGTMTTTFNFKQTGEKLEGTVSGRQSDTPITDGKVTGDDVSFVVVRNFNGNEFKQTYTGTVSGNEIKFKIEMGGDRPAREMTAKKAE